MSNNAGDDGKVADKPREPITCRMKWDDPIMRFCAFTTSEPVRVKDGQFFEFIEYSAFEQLKANYDAAVRLADMAHRAADIERDELRAQVASLSAEYSNEVRTLRDELAEAKAGVCLNCDAKFELSNAGCMDLLRAKEKELESARAELQRAQASMHECYSVSSLEKERERCAGLEEKLKYAEKFILENSGTALDAWIKNDKERKDDEEKWGGG